MDIGQSLNSRDSFPGRKFKNRAPISCSPGPILWPPTISFELHAEMAEEIDLEKCSSNLLGHRRGDDLKMHNVPGWLLHFPVGCWFWLMPSPLLSPTSSTVESIQEMQIVWPNIWNPERRPCWRIHLTEHLRNSGFSAYAKNADHKLLHLVFHLLNKNVVIIVHVIR